MEILKEKLICLNCAGKLIVNSNWINCEVCHKAYPIIDNVPVIVDESKSIFKINDIIKKDQAFFKMQKTKVKLPSLSLNFISRKNFKKISALLKQKDKCPKILVIGGGIDGVGIEEIKNEKEFVIVESDISWERNTEIIFDAHNIPYENDTFDLVIIQAVLEHVLYPNLVVAEIFRVLKANGIVYSEIPFIQHVHGGKYDFQRFTLLGQKVLFKEFDEIDSGILCGPAMAFTWSLQYFLSSLFSGVAFIRMSRLLSRVFFPLKYIDYLILENKGSYNAASAFYFIGKKLQGFKGRKLENILDEYKGF